MAFGINYREELAVAVALMNLVLNSPSQGVERVHGKNSPFFFSRFGNDSIEASLRTLALFNMEDQLLAGNSH